jgi:hypothetical protein
VSLLRISNAVYNFMKVPTKPPSNVEEVRNQYDRSLVQQLEEVESRCDAYLMELTVLTFNCKALSYSADMDAHRASQPIHPSPSPRNPKVRSQSSPLSSMLCYFTTCEYQLESTFAINLLCLWRWPMEGYHGSIWIRPAARSSGKIVSMCCLQFSFNCVD